MPFLGETRKNLLENTYDQVLPILPKSVPVAVQTTL